MEKFCIWALTQPERKPDGADKKPICRVLGRGVCSTRFATSNADAQSTKITWCPNKSWTTPQNIVGALCWKNWRTLARERFAATPNRDRKSTRLNSSHRCISYAVFCLKKKKQK